MTVIALPTAQSYRQRTVICFFDLQREYVSPGRPVALQRTDPWLQNCRTLLAFARRSKLQIAHFRRLGRSAIFNPVTEWSQWIEEFRPNPASEMAFERDSPSPYVCQGFARFIESIQDPCLVIAGLTGTHACLTTAIESYVRGHQAIFVGDASASPALGSAPAESVHSVITDLIGLYAQVTTTEKLMGWLGEPSRVRTA
jgi:isochorismate hydrolase